MVRQDKKLADICHLGLSVHFFNISDYRINWKNIKFINNENNR